MVRQSKPRPKQYSHKDLAQVLIHMEGLCEQQAVRITQLVFNSLVWAILRGQTVYIPNLGKFEAYYLKSRGSYHKTQRRRVVLPPSVRVRYRPSITLRRMVSERIDQFKVKAIATGNLDEEDTEGGDP
jgi:nucleoid DNA-binding protein